MKLTMTATAFGLLFGLATAQISIPSCARNCVSTTTGGTSTDCSGLDIGCFCRDSGFISQVACCIDSACTSSSDRSSARNYASQICSAAGVSISSGDFDCNSATTTTTGSATTVATTGTTTSGTSTGTYTTSWTSTPSATHTNVAAKPGAYALEMGALGGALAAGMALI